MLCFAHCTHAAIDSAASYRPSRRPFPFNFTPEILREIELCEQQTKPVLNVQQNTTFVLRAAHIRLPKFGQMFSDVDPPGQDLPSKLPEPWVEKFVCDGAKFLLLCLLVRCSKLKNCPPLYRASPPDQNLNPSCCICRPDKRLQS